jgi:hypothetical protein
MDSNINYIKIKELFYNKKLNKLKIVYNPIRSCIFFNIG